MKYLKNYQKYNENVVMVSNSQPNDSRIFENSTPFNWLITYQDCDAYNRVIESKKKFPNIKKMEIDGFEVLVGKDAESNDYLTMQMRIDGDLWFHAQGFPGSHIILRCGDRIADQTTKNKVAELAAKNSKASGLATVVCCPIGLVKKKPGSNPGKVEVENSLNIEKIDINL